ncbi:BREX-1 system adenine-specific DNA-methyltransferase PglX [Sphingobacterium sp. DR205]|uniref:BREX-1 system adenine-specific DNA-methyltransferase PglX n=1 Tax=Sphingobacterium sp. DR205 TaxID=2713573 RepID=UPI0013E4DB03|nr:BREX-1 system adenine-specific DNA-methyltransferase PglX [Sphingobacterium sp. DR205]QIH32328.1 BREX-1 system adenine-specific DNA-methyltransferase PglX [Sphingobacterium sp. DR205]
MNTVQLKRFAQEARKKLTILIGGRVEAVLTQDTSTLRGQASTINELNQEIAEIGKEALIEKVAYTWFNRLVALRFMDANGFQPLGVNVLSPTIGKDGNIPQILNDIHAGHFPEDLKVDRQYINDVLNGVISSNNPDNTMYRHVLIAVCNDLHRIFPFLFEAIDDYTELLLPDDLTTQFSIVSDVVNGMSDEDCKEVEIIGWLYQFYVSELNADLISSKKVYKKDELAPASQLFTPKWIVEYMVDNTLGQLLIEQFSQSKITEGLDYYIKPDYVDKIPKRASKKLEEIKFFEPCVGSAHILSYAFDVFYKIYEEQGYSNTEIPELIIKNNLFGVDIDPRAAQMAAMVLMMKGRQKYRRFFRSVERNNIKPNIYFYQDFEGDPKFKNATAFGSLIQVTEQEVKSFAVEEGTLFSEQQIKLKELYELLGRQYDVVVTNPPYISSSRMEASLKQYVEKTWPETKSDLFATFILRCLELCKKDGFTGYMTPFVWMFISSYEKLRNILIDEHLIHSLIQLEYSGFDGATVPICTFTLRNQYIEQAKGSYIRLSDFKGAAAQAPKTLEAIQNPNCSWFYTAFQNDFEKIPGHNIGYWSSKSDINTFASNKLLNNYADPRQGLATGNNERFLRFIWEVDLVNNKWVLCSKGGPFRKWFGNIDLVLDWENDGYELKNYKLPNGKLRSVLRNQKYYFCENGMTWSTISSSKASFRYFDKNWLFESKGSVCFPKDQRTFYKLFAYLNSNLVNHFLKVLSPTLDFHEGPIGTLPFDCHVLISENVVLENINISKKEWNSRESSWDFLQNELVRFNSQNIESAIESYKDYWREEFFTLHQNEEELNCELLNSYGLQDELTPNVPFEEITILKEEVKIVDNELVFQEDELISQLISYAIGCVFGRYSLDKEGLILANQGETIADYLSKVEKAVDQLQFVPNADNVIPLLEEEWFDDDIVNRVKAFIRAVWGEETYGNNMQYIEDVLGKDLRKYLIKDFYKDHLKRYKKRPIYWQFSSPKGHFNVLIYMHRYTQDTLNHILNSYLRPFMEKVRNDITRQQDIIVTGSASEQGKAHKRQDKLRDILRDCEVYEHDILYPLAGERISIDLNDGVLVNYNKFGHAIASVAGLNDVKTKNKVKGFDWIDTSTIR